MKHLYCDKFFSHIAQPYVVVSRNESLFDWCDLGTPTAACLSTAFYVRSNLVTVSCMQSVLHLQGEPHQHRRADQRHEADPEHSRAQAAEHRRRPRRQQGREDRHRRRHQSTWNFLLMETEEQRVQIRCRKKWPGVLQPLDELHALTTEPNKQPQDERFYYNSRPYIACIMSYVVSVADLLIHHEPIRAKV